MNRTDEETNSTGKCFTPMSGEALMNLSIGRAFSNLLFYLFIHFINLFIFVHLESFINRNHKPNNNGADLTA